MSKRPILYSDQLSCAVRAAWLAAAAIDLELENVKIDLRTGKQFSEEYLKINPQHTVPTLDDNGNVLWDSHAISSYLIGKYAKDDSLYSKDLYIRARIDQRLHFDSGVLFPRVRHCVVHVLQQNGYEFSDADVQANHDAYALLESFLQSDLYLVGNTYTLADLANVATVATLDIITPIDAAKYPKIRKWLTRLIEVPFFEEAHNKPLAVFSSFFEQVKAANRAAAGK